MIRCVTYRTSLVEESFIHIGRYWTNIYNLWQNFLFWQSILFYGKTVHYLVTLSCTRDMLTNVVGVEATANSLSPKICLISGNLYHSKVGNKENKEDRQFRLDCTSRHKTIELPPQYVFRRKIKLPVSWKLSIGVWNMRTGINLMVWCVRMNYGEFIALVIPTKTKLFLTEI